MEASPSVPREVALTRLSPAPTSAPAHAAAAPVRPGSPVPAWLAFAALIVIAANLLAGVTTYVTVELMHGVSPFALEARGVRARRSCRPGVASPTRPESRS